MRPPNRRRRGSNLIEFALLLPLFLGVVSISFDYGWYFFMRAIAQNAVRQGCRAGAVVPPDDDAEGAAADAIASGMTSHDFFGIDCESASESRCGITVTSSGSSPEESLECNLQLEYPGMTGLIPMPELVQVRASVLYELQR